LPCSQSLQPAARGSANCPSSHAEQLPALYMAEYVPASHGAHEASSSLKVPGTQADVGTAVGAAVGEGVGAAVGLAEGLCVGPAVGLGVGTSVGLEVGLGVGVMVGKPMDGRAPHCDQPVHAVDSQSTGHACVLQPAVCVRLPHAMPPPVAGCRTALERENEPAPQDALQASKPLHAPTTQSL
jgi:hypothetical protein